MRNKWSIVHESDDDNGNPTCWVSKINHEKYGKYVWISLQDGYDVEIDRGQIEVLINRKSLASAKRWVAMNLIG